MEKLGQTLTSLEVAEMVEKEHHKLLRDIRRYTAQFNQSNLGLVNGDKIDSVEFWLENTYLDAKGEGRSCYLVTKKGCEFIAHKLTGTKGTAFTARYINRFHEMEQALQEAAEEKPRLQESDAYLLKNCKTWYQRNSWKMKEICEFFDWERSYLCHKILRELSDIYNLGAIEEMYYRHKGYYPKYKLELLDFAHELRDIADRYLEYLIAEMER